jgi:hypothetical protein
VQEQQPIQLGDFKVKGSFPESIQNQIKWDKRLKMLRKTIILAAGAFILSNIKDNEPNMGCVIRASCLQK